MDMDEDTYPANRVAELAAWSPEDDCHVELTVRVGGRQTILRQEWPNDPAVDQHLVACREAEYLTRMAWLMFETKTVPAPEGAE